MLKFTLFRDKKFLKNLAVFLILLAPLSLFLPHLDQFPFSPGSPYSDFTISHYPNAVYLQRSLQEWGQVPLWSNQILSGYPFAADPLSSLWYLPAWIAVALPLPLGINFTILCHLLWGGVGMYLYLRRLGRTEAASILGAFVFELAPKVMAHYAAGHVTLIYAVCWTPWLLLAGKQAGENGWNWSSGLILAAILLADVRWAPYAFLVWLIFVVVELSQRHTEWSKIIWCGLGNLAIGIGLSAPLLIPMLEYTGLSSRSLLTTSDNLVFSLPLVNLTNLFFPTFQGSMEWVFYPGIFALMLIAWGCTLPEFWRQNWGWLAGLAGCVIFALGENQPLGAWLAALPGMSLLRVPARSLFLVSFFCAILLAWVIDFTLKFNEAKKDEVKTGNFLPPFALLAFIVLVAAGVWLVSGYPEIDIMWTAFFAIFSMLLLFWARYKKPAKNLWLIFAGLVILLDAGLLDYFGIEFRPNERVLTEQAEPLAWVSSQGQSFFRIYSPSYSVPQQAAASRGFELSDGIDPLQLKAYVQFMQSASGISEQSYSVTLPPFKTGKPLIDNQFSLPDPALLGILNVKYVLAEFDLNQTGLALAAQFGRTRIYENAFFRSRAWVESSTQSLLSNPVKIKAWSPNRIELEASGPGKLVLSEIEYPGWLARIDGNDVQITPAYEILRSIDLPGGSHSVVFEFVPPGPLVGLGIALVTILVLGIGILVGRKWK